MALRHLRPPHVVERPKMKRWEEHAMTATVKNIYIQPGKTTKAIHAHGSHGTPAFAGQCGERVEDPSSPQLTLASRDIDTPHQHPFKTSWKHHHGIVDPTPRTTEDPSATTPNLGLSSQWQKETTSEATPPGPPRNLHNHPGPDTHCTQLLLRGPTPALHHPTHL